MPAEEIENREQIARFLDTDRVVNAYPLGYLDEKYAEECLWFGERDRGDLTAVALLYTGLSRAGLFTVGAADAIQPILRAMAPHMPARMAVHFAPDHRASVESMLAPVKPPRRMNRMGLTRDTFRERDTRDVEVTALTHRDTGAILRLYSVWPDHFFEPYQLESGLYFGVRQGDELVCAVGCHNVSETFDVAAIGNLVSHPDHRGRGFAVACTAALLRAAFERVSHVTLDVEEDNVPAMRTYQHFGFALYGDFFECEMMPAGGREPDWSNM